MPGLAPADDDVSSGSCDKNEKLFNYMIWRLMNNHIPHLGIRLSIIISCMPWHPLSQYLLMFLSILVAISIVGVFAWGRVRQRGSQAFSQSCFNYKMAFASN